MRGGATATLGDVVGGFVMVPVALRRNVIAVVALLVAGCGAPGGSAGPAAAPTPVPQYRASECNAVTDEEVGGVVGSVHFHRVVTNDVGCFWQEDSVIGTFGIGLGISTWWYRGSDLDTERSLERGAGRVLAERSIGGNEGFTARDVNACSVYVAKSADVIAWSIQTMNPVDLPDLCSIAERLAKLSQDRVN